MWTQRKENHINFEEELGMMDGGNNGAKMKSNHHILKAIKLMKSLESKSAADKMGDGNKTENFDRLSTELHRAWATHGMRKEPRVPDKSDQKWLRKLY